MEKVESYYVRGATQSEVLNHHVNLLAEENLGSLPIVNLVSVTDLDQLLEIGEPAPEFGINGGPHSAGAVPINDSFLSLKKPSTLAIVSQEESENALNFEDQFRTHLEQVQTKFESERMVTSCFK